MLEAHRLAGFVAAHSAWSICDGALLIPIMGTLTEDNKFEVRRIMEDDLEEAVAIAHDLLDKQQDNVKSAVIAFDAVLTVDDQQMDAIVLKLKDYSSPESVSSLAIPYASKDSDGGFKIFRLKVLQWLHCDGFELNDCMESFFSGVDSHKQGIEVWEKYYDEQSH
jgi:hypothetical protein